MVKGFPFERLKTYLFGVAIGSVLVALIFLARAETARREAAAADEATRAAPPDSTERFSPQ